MISMQIYFEVSNKVEVFIDNVIVLRREFNYQYPGVNVEKVLNRVHLDIGLHNCLFSDDSWSRSVGFLVWLG